MGQDQYSELSKEMLRELSFDLLREWWLDATQALVDKAGSEVALRHLKPYFINTGVAGARNLQNLLNVSAEELLRLEMIYHLWPMLLGTMQRIYRADDGSMIYETVDCVTGGISQEACMCYCDIMANAYFSELSPGLEHISHRCLSWGDPLCQGLLKQNGEEAKVAATEEFLVPMDQIPGPPEEMFLEFMVLSVFGEMWANATRAFIDFSGPEKALERLCFHMRHSGLSFGIRMADRFGAKERGLQSILEIVELVQMLHQRKGTCTRSDDNLDGKLNECPFSSSPPEICLQYEAFFNGVCEAIDPSYEFVYDRMMTKGDRTCHWTIRRKGQSQRERLKEEAFSDNPARALALRFGRGEISLEEYEKGMASLREHGLVK